MTFSTFIEGPDGRFGAYVAHPGAPNGAALVVIQEIFGVNDVMRDLADHYASQGYIAIVPDLFWRIEPGIDITDKTPEDMTRAFDLFGRFQPNEGLVDIQASIDFARTLAPKVGAVGYCLGGLLAYLTAAQTDIDASVSFYGVSIDTQTDQVDKIKIPLLMHVAAEDKFVTKEAQVIIGEMAARHPLIRLFTYSGLDHAFARPGGEHYDVAGASLANQRTTDFFRETLLP
jgi:carboxymethylenebutenolidase